MTSATARRSLVARLARAAGVFGVFAIAGPALGGLLVFCCVFPVLLFGIDLTSAPPPDPETTGGTMLSLIGALPVFIMMAYAFGGVQAILTGLYAGYAEIRNGFLSGKAAIAASVVATLIWIAIIYSPLDPLDAADASAERKMMQGAQIAMALIPIGLVCALFCRWLSRKLGLLSSPVTHHA